ncbi:g_PROTEIN_RECEP_F1_2 domain-containing protein [Nephila pilipes]|uniref:G_PROTEIN_RECEP_F1_2 domain-containing protein n=1 Tax=Nephila pilipes TaxID=299642 RepID=A0A8X6TZ35_NEPPI|nr:g_PROTEIN_RECEP_F1_2 domain-containing protein [Nephila pilipes]
MSCFHYLALDPLRPGTEIALRETHPRNQYSTSSKSPLKPKSKPALVKLESDNATVKQVIKMLVAVVILFIICWAPILINNVLTSFDVLDRLNYGYLKPMRTAFHLMSYFNSCINPCVYGFLSANFRNSFKAALVTCLCGKRQKIRERGLSRTGTTSLSYARSTFIT